MATDLRYPRITQRVSLLTDVGMVREHNEDSALVDPEGDFFIVADGMGGHAAGEVASAMTVEAVGAALSAARKEIADFANDPTDDRRKGLIAVLDHAVRSAHQAVFERGIREAEKQGMGTTLDVVLLAGAEAFIAHVGDSRTYLVREGKAAQITTDHTVAEVLVIEGKLTPEEAQVSPLRTILVNAIGVAAEVGVEMGHVKLRKGDYLLLCSDGLHDYFPTEKELAEVIVEAEPAAALEYLITTAKDRGGHDNITGILFHVLAVPDVQGIGSDDTGQFHASPEAVPHAVLHEDTQPVSLRELAATSRVPPLGVASDPGALTAAEFGDAPTMENTLPEDLKGATIPIKQIMVKKKPKPKKGKKSSDDEPERASTEELEPDDKD